MIFSEKYRVDTGKEFFEMELNDSWVLRLSKDLEHVIITKEVEPGEFVAFFLKEVIKGLLAALQLCHDGIQSVKEASNIGQFNHMLVIGHILHNVAVVLIQSPPAPLLLRKSPTHEDWLKIDPFTLDLVKTLQSPL
jgi:hypothetical protein